MGVLDEAIAGNEVEDVRVHVRGRGGERLPGALAALDAGEAAR
jgi:hypothetical protein